MTILFACGGTGGHLYPAIAIAEELQRKRSDMRIAFVGTKNKIEARVVPAKGYAFFTIWISGFHRRLTIDNLLFPVKVIVALIQSFFLIKKIKPNVVVGTGGYVCGPVLFMASRLGIPTIVHESNSYPGVTTRLLARRVTAVFITFELTKKWISKEARIELLGNPTREILSGVTKKEGASFFRLDEKKQTVFVFGGSLGAQSINAVMPSVIEWAVRNNIQILWQTGESDWASAEKIPQNDGIHVMKYVEKMEYAYAAADVVICRSGATTLAELTRLGKPAILVPYPHAAADHQRMNAEALVEAGAALLVHDRELPAQLLPTVQGLLGDENKMRMMSARSIQLGKPDAGSIIAEKIIQTAGIR